MEFVVDNIDLVRQIKLQVDSNNYDLNNFYNGIQLSATLDDLDLDLFGCWNSACKDNFQISHSESLHQKYLVKLLNKYNENVTAKNKLRFLFGDNLYFDKKIKKTMKADKDLKKKIIKTGILDEVPIFKVGEKDINLKDMSQKLLQDGFSCMSEQKPTFMCLGNHDIEPLFVLHQEIKKSYEDLIITDNKVRFSSNWIQPTAFYSVELKVNDSNLLFVIIDTNLLDEEYDKNVLSNMEEKKLKMMGWIEKTLSSHPNHMKIVIGHCPIFYFSHKDKGPKFLSREINGENANAGNNFIELYKILVQNKVKIYMAADEHNLQHIYDAEHDLIHLTCGASPGGGGADETNNFNEEQELVFSSSQIDIPTEIKQKMVKKLVLNAPSFMKLTVHPNIVQINLVAPSNLTVHSSVICSKHPEKCVNNNPETEKPEVYGIISLPKYLEWVSVYDCEKYRLARCKEE